jgi:hypothetical protein
MKLFFSILTIIIFIATGTIANANSFYHTSQLHSSLSFDLHSTQSEIKLYVHKRSDLDYDKLNRAVIAVKNRIGDPYISGSCAKKMHLSIYIIPYSTLNNRSLMKDMINWSSVSPENIVGIFDNRHEYEKGFIYIADAYGEAEVISTIAHEMYHAKQRANCKSGPEDDAVNFEESFCNTAGFC